MEREDLRLVEPSLEFREDFQEMAREYLAAGAQHPYNKARDEEALKDFAGYIVKLLDQARGLQLPAGFVPCSTYWLVRDGRAVVAESGLRHRLTEGLEHHGGHIGYRVRPSERRKGYGTLLCALTLEKARAMGLKRVLITCDADNAASARIIVKNGGRLENQVISRFTGKLVNRYWIEMRWES